MFLRAFGIDYGLVFNLPLCDQLATFLEGRHRSFQKSKVVQRFTPKLGLLVVPEILIHLRAVCRVNATTLLCSPSFVACQDYKWFWSYGNLYKGSAQTDNIITAPRSAYLPPHLIHADVYYYYLPFAF